MESLQGEDSGCVIYMMPGQVYGNFWVEIKKSTNALITILILGNKWHQLLLSDVAQFEYSFLSL